MKRILIAALIAFVAITLPVNAQEIESLTISPGEAEVSVGDSLQFEAALLDTSGAAIDTTLVWHVASLDSAGTVDDTGLFIADAVGDAIVTVWFGSLSDTAFVSVVADEPDPPEGDVVIESVEIVDESIETSVGDSVEVTVVVWDSSDSQADTVVTWTVVADPAVGTINEDGLFSATAVGTGIIIASVGDIADSVVVTVTEATEQVADSIDIKPNKLTAAISDSISFTADILDEEGEKMDGDVVWSLSDSTLASISEDGLFIALAEGTLNIIAEFGDIMEDMQIIISEDGIGPGGEEQARNNVRVMRELGSGPAVKVGNGKEQEGDTLKVTGLGSPFNFLNGMQLYVPEGSLNEDITITVKLPKVGKIKVSATNPLDSEVEYPDSIMAGLSFEVSVNDSVIHPYYFETPLEVTIPYRQALLDKLGITAEDIGMYFMTDDGELVADGITDIVLDEQNKLITGKVEHFSDVVLAQKPASPTSVSENISDGFSLMANYPNPFNPTTTISFNTAELSNVNVTIYNMLGQHVKTLMNEIKPAGMYSVIWNGKNESGASVTSGMYLYRFEAGRYIETRKLLLMK
ncbi:Ig-like domain-containing protein [Candidatus Latescibacterota bacterium]